MTTVPNPHAWATQKAEPPSRLWALVPCAGAGQRAGGDSPKQYQRVAGRPLVEHTLNALAAVPGWVAIVVVIAPDDRAQPGQAHPLVQVHTVGGASRADTVRNGLAQLLASGASAGDWVLVHDAARCLVQPKAIERLISVCTADASGDLAGGLLATPLVDTLKEQQDALNVSFHARVSATRPREGKWLAQTPQMFRIGALVAALYSAMAAQVHITDEASAMERVGAAPILVDGGALNIKVTYPQDFELAEAVIRYRQMALTGARG
jgi:2-C-methyl-D-erythritol 4-phosphate cytidylyltransferase